MESLLYPPAGAHVRFLNLPGRDPCFVYLAGLGSASTAAFPRAVSGSALGAHAAILPDWLGCGFSDRPQDFGYRIEEHADVIAWLLDQLGRKQCIVVGWSMGGSVAIMLAERRPDLVRRLVLAEANLDAGGGELSSGIAALSEQQFVATGFSALVELGRQNITTENQWFAAMLGPVQIAAPHALHRSAVSLVAGVEPSWRERLYKLTLPRLFIFGETSLPDPDFEILPSNGVPTAIVPRAGHAMVFENPDGLASAILSFAES